MGAITQRFLNRSSALAITAAAIVLAATQTASGAPPPLVPVAPPQGPVVPPPDGYAFDNFSDNGAFTIGKNTVTKAKTTFRIPLELMHAYTTLALTKDFLYIDNSADLYVISPAGQAERYGKFQPFKVSTLAFGALPVTATVQLSQPLLPTGYLSPLHAAQRIVNANGQNTTTRVTGQLNLTISDVTIDQVPLNVGSDCGTAAPLPIVLIGDPKTYPGPVPGGTLTGSVTIGAFAHCGVPGGEDLSPIFTRMLSGPGNPVVLNQGKLGPWSYPESCPLLPPGAPLNDPGCTIPPPPN